MNSKGLGNKVLLGEFIKSGKSLMVAGKMKISAK